MKTNSKLLVIAFLLFCFFTPFLSAQTCDEKDVFEIDRIKQEVETMLINTTTGETTLKSGEKLVASYKDGYLIKLSVDNGGKGDYFSAELFFRDGFIRYISEDHMNGRNMLRDYYYFKDDKLICFTNEDKGDYNNAKLYSKAEKKWLKKVEKYLEAIQ